MQTGVLVLSAPFVRLRWIVLCVWRVSGQGLNNAEGELCFQLSNGWRLQLSRARSSRGLSPSDAGHQPPLCPHLQEKVESFAQ